MLAADVVTGLLRAHVEAIRADPMLTHAHIIFGPERNTGHDGDFMWQSISRFQPITPCWEKGQQNGVGIWTTLDAKMQYAFALKFQFATRNISIYEARTRTRTRTLMLP